MNVFFLSLKQTLILASVILVQLILLTNLRFTVWPEMILYPWLLNKGFVLYKDIINPYFPLLQLINGGFFYFFSSSIMSLKVLTYLFIFASDLSLFFFSFKFSKSYLKALISLVIYIFLQLSFGGNGLWFELAATPFLVLSLCVILREQTIRAALLSGIFLTIAGFIKQNAFLFLIPVVFLLIYSKRLNLILLFLVPMVLSFLTLILGLQLWGITHDFLTWAIQLPLSLSKQPEFILLPTKRQFILVLLLLSPIIFYILTKTKKDLKIFWTLVLLISASFAFPRFEDFHLQILVAFSCLILAFLNRKIQFVYLIGALLLLSLTLNKFWQKPDRFIDSPTLALSSYMKQLPGEVYLLNSPELAYFFADKLPPKPWGTIFPWYYEDNNLSDRVVQNLENRKVEYVIIGSRLPGSKYQLGHYIPADLENYISQRYEKVEAQEGFEILKRK